ncbi:MAG: DUF951 domain-containing protein [Chloroflexota bacterium]|nr:DUF951 domain-containing protein [Chloroflexota bacterium]
MSHLEEQEREMLDFNIGDTLNLRKPHPCGSHSWVVVRLGADIGIQCQGCQRRVLLPRSELERRVKSRIPADGEGQR